MTTKTHVMWPYDASEHKKRLETAPTPLLLQHFALSEKLVLMLA